MGLLSALFLFFLLLFIRRLYLSLYIFEKNIQKLRSCELRTQERKYWFSFWGVFGMENIRMIVVNESTTQRRSFDWLSKIIKRIIHIGFPKPKNFFTS